MGQCFPNEIHTQTHAEQRGSRVGHSFVVADRHAHYRCRFTSVDHLLLARKLALINERNDDNHDVKILTSYDDDPGGYIRSLYRPEFGWRVRQIDVQYSGGHHAAATHELVIANFELGEKL